MTTEKNVNGAKLGKRLGAHILDSLVLVGINMVLAAIIVMASDSEKMMLALENPAYAAVYTPYQVLMVGMAVCSFLYYVLSESGKKEASIGKRACKVQVVKADGTKVRTLDILVRNAVKVLPNLINAVFTSTAMLTISGILSIVYYIVPLCNKQHKALHDYVAGTVVAKREDVEAARSVVTVPPVNIVLPKPQKEEKAADDIEKTVAPSVMAKKLICVSGQYQGAELPLDALITMGRDSAACDLIFDNETKGVSKVHCKLLVRDGSLFLMDMGSSYGTIVNNSKQLIARDEVELRIGDRFRIGKQEEFIIQ